MTDFDEDVEVHPAGVDRFADVEVLLRPKSPGASACWCQAYRLTPSEYPQTSTDERHSMLGAACEGDFSPGVIAYVGGIPAGWCGFGPRRELGRLQRSKTIQRIDDEPVLSIICFVVAPGFRGRGLSRALLRGVIEYASRQGVNVLEGYPLDSDGGRVGAAHAFVGTTGLFAAEGFIRMEATTSRSGGRIRWIMRRRLDALDA